MHEARGTAAQVEYERYDFGDVGVEDAGGWEYAVPGNEWTRPVFVVADADEEVDSTKITFVVRFKPGSADIDEVYAIDSKGSIWGHRRVVVEPVPMHLTIDLTLLRRPKPFADQAAALAWVLACLNGNTNHVEATAEIKD